MSRQNRTVSCSSTFCNVLSAIVTTQPLLPVGQTTCDHVASKIDNNSTTHSERGTSMPQKSFQCQAVHLEYFFTKPRPHLVYFDPALLVVTSGTEYEKAVLLHKIKLDVVGEKGVMKELVKKVLVHLSRYYRWKPWTLQ